MSQRTQPSYDAEIAFAAGDYRDVPLAERQRRAELRAILRRHGGVREIVVFPASIGWELPFLFQRPQQMARALARRGCLVFYSEPEYANRHPDGFDPVDERLYIANVPPQVFDEIDAPVAVVFIYSWEHIRFLRRPRVVYEHLDSLDLLGATPARVRAHRTLLGRASVVTATAERLLREVAPFRPDALLCRNAVDTARFAIEPSAESPGAMERPRSLRDAEVIVGYTGTLSAEWFDYRLVAEVARARPQYGFVLIGADDSGGLVRSGLLDLPNVCWLGPRPYDELPQRVAGFDAAMIPFVVSGVTQSSSPLKLFEYLAAGRPVVATELEECLAVPLVRTARDAGGFANALDAVRGLAVDADFREECRRFAAANTWEVRAEQVLAALPAVASAATEGGDRSDWRICQLASDLSEAEMAIATQAWTIQAERERHGDAERALEGRLAAANAEIAEHVDARARAAVEIAAREGDIRQLEYELARVTNSTGWRLVLRQRRLRQQLRSFLRRLAPDSVRRALGRLSPSAHQMSWYAYAFDRYKERRLAVCGRDLSGLRLPSEPGLVSIVLPVYNGADFLPEALRSILAQSYAHFELIAVDDGSTDESGRILDECADGDTRVRVIHQPNRKLPAALSAGFRAARGQYLTWTSCDNRLAPDFLARMVAVLERHPSWDATWGNVDIIDDQGRPLRGSPWYGGYQSPPGSEHVRFPEDPSELNTWPNNYVGAAFLYRDRVAALVGDYSRFRFGTEDYDYWMRLNAFLTLRHTDFAEPLYEYRFCRGSLTDRDEEIGITRSRGPLMVFDDFRRDFALAPQAWWVESAGGPAADALRDALRREVERAGHLWLGAEAVGTSWPRLWAPLVYVRIEAPGATTASAPGLSADAGAPSHGPRPDVPESALRVLLLAGAAPSDLVPGPRWHLCVANAGSPFASGDASVLVATDPGVLFAAVDVRSRSHQLDRIEQEIHQPPRPEVAISVIVCTWRRGERLGACLTALAQQTLAHADHEIVVVNNDPADASVREQVERVRAAHFADDPERLRLLDCPFQGLSHARNAGIAAARGAVCTFVDDDAVPRPGLLEHLHAAFAEHPRAGVVGGHIRLAPPEPIPEVLERGGGQYWSQFLTPHTTYTRVDSWWDLPWGANWSARREALVAIGGFRTRYGRSGNDFSGGEEMTAARLIQQLGWEVGVEPRAEVLHDVEPERYTLEHVRRTIRAATMVNYRAQCDLYLPRETTVRSTLHQCLRLAAMRADRVVRPRGAVEDAVIRYRFAAQRELLRRQLRDFFARLGRPTSIRDA
jgi:glycosyltransferase involved in cell wall biosynthesis